MREIDITKEDVRCCDELIVEADHIDATYELWLEVDKYFGTNTRNTDTWINFYTDWRPDGKITAMYVIESDEKSKEYDWELTLEEQDFFRKKMEDFCRKTSNRTLIELWESSQEKKGEKNEY